MENNINWSNTKTSNEIEKHCDLGFISIETFLESGYNIGYLINVRHGDNFNGHYVAIYRGDRFLSEGDCPNGGEYGPVKRPVDVIQILKKCLPELPDEYKLVIKNIYKI